MFLPPFIWLPDAGIGKIPIYIKGVMDRLKRSRRLQGDLRGVIECTIGF